MSLYSRVARAAGTGALVATMLFSSSAALAAETVTRQAETPSSAIQIAEGNDYTGAIGPAPATGGGTQFTYYKFKLDGTNRVVHINLEVYPDNPTILSKVSFVVYGPQSVSNPSKTYARSSSTPKVTPNVTADLTNSEAGEYLIQIRNDSSATVGYDLWVTNLPPQPAAAPATPARPAAAAPAPAAPVAAAPAAPAAAATSAPAAQATASPAAGNSGNNFSGDLGPMKSDTFQFDYPGDGSVYTVNVQINPDNGDVLKNAGFEVYRPNGALQVKGGSQQKLVPNVSANVISQVPGTYTVKVFNNNPGVAVNYTVTLVTGKKENQK